MPDFVIPLLVLIVTFVLRIPISLGLVSAGVMYLVSIGADIGLVADKMLNGMYGNYTILAVPLFVLMANLMNSGKVTSYLFDFCKACIGKKRGALAYVNILVSLIFSGMSGSAVADASGIGMIEIKAMEEDGYDIPFSSALTSATSTVGPIVPPSIPMVIYAMLSGTSVGALFMGGILPGLLICIFLALYVAYISAKRDYPRGIRYGWKEFKRYTLKALPALLTPAILFAGIYGGVMTPTEAGAVAALYALVVAVFVYRTMTPKQLLQSFTNTALQTGKVTIMTAASCVISYMVAAEGISTAVANYVLSLTDNTYFLLFLINVIFLLLGMVIDVGVMQYVFIPIVLPIVSALGINLVHFGVMIVLNMMIGLSTPPFGMCLFITATMFGGNLKQISKEIIPMVLVMIGVLFLIAYAPVIVTGIPHLMGFM